LAFFTLNHANIVTEKKQPQVIIELKVLKPCDCEFGATTRSVDEISIAN